MSDYEVRESMTLPGYVDVLLHIGLEYSVPQYLVEAEEMGASKRISLTSIPDRLVPGVSKLFLWHSHAIPMVTADGLTMVDLVVDLQERGILDGELDPEEFEWNPTDWLLPADFVPPGMLEVTCAIQRDRKIRQEIEDQYRIKWQGGVICFTILGKLRYILKADETDLPDHLQPYRHLIDAVRVVRVDDEGNPIDDDGDQCALGEEE